MAIYFSLSLSFASDFVSAWRERVSKMVCYYGFLSVSSKNHLKKVILLIICCWKNGIIIDNMDDDDGIASEWLI